MTGLNNNEQDFYLGLLASSERLHAEAEKISEERKGYSQIIKNMASDFGKALKERDYEKLNIMRLTKCALSILHWRLKI